MDIEQAIMLIGSILGTGGIVAFLKARSDIRNANKSADITALEKTISTIQNSYKELQDRYQEMMADNENKCKSLAERLQFLEIEYVRQSQQNSENLKRITELEIDLKKANCKIELLESDLRKKDIDVMRLEQENIELRKQQNKMSLMQ